MALILCPECKKQISDKADLCPFCGCPSRYFQFNDSIKEEQKKKDDDLQSPSVSKDLVINDCVEGKTLDNKSVSPEIIPDELEQNHAEVIEAQPLPKNDQDTNGKEDISPLSDAAKNDHVMVTEADIETKENVKLGGYAVFVRFQLIASVIFTSITSFSGISQSGPLLAYQLITFSMCILYTFLIWYGMTFLLKKTPLFFIIYWGLMLFPDIPAIVYGASTDQIAHLIVGLCFLVANIFYFFSRDHLFSDKKRAFYILNIIAIAFFIVNNILTIVGYNMMSSFKQGSLNSPYVAAEYNGDIYKSNTLGIAFKNPSGFSYYDEDMLATVDNVENPDNEGLKEAIENGTPRTEMFTANDTTAEMVYVRVFFAGDNAVKTVNETNYQQMYDKESSRAKDVTGGDEEITFCGHDAKLIYTDGTYYDDLNMGMSTVYFTQNGYVGLVCATADNTQRCNELLEYFFNPDQQTYVPSDTNTAYSKERGENASSAVNDAYSKASDYIVNITSGVFHETTCPYAPDPSSAALNQKVHDSFEALSEKYGPCQYCLSFIVNTTSNMIHRTTCEYAPSPSNGAYLMVQGPLDALISEYTPCPYCF